MRTKKDILIAIHDDFLDRLVRQEFDKEIYRDMPEEERKLKDVADKAKSEMLNLQQLQKIGAKGVRIGKIEKAEKAVAAAEKAFTNARYKRIVMMAKEMIKEEK